MGTRIWSRRRVLTAVLGVALCLSLAANAYLSAANRRVSAQLGAQRQQALADVVSAMADIEVNLKKLMIASGAPQSVSLLGETALLARHVETGLSQLPMRYEGASDAMKFVGQVGQYALALAVRLSDGSMLSNEDERQLAGMLGACQALNAHLVSVGERIYTEPVEAVSAIDGDGAMSWAEEAIAGESAIEYPSLIFDGPFSDARAQGQPKGLTGERVTRETAREAAARYAGVDVRRVRDAADSGGQFEAFGFTAQTDAGSLSVQITGMGAHLLWMMPEQAAYMERLSEEECLRRAQEYLIQTGFGEMEPCFVQRYDGMVVANFAAVQDGVLLYPDQVKLQVSMESGAVVGAECMQFLMNHTQRVGLVPSVSEQEAREALSVRLTVLSSRLCVIPDGDRERLCWGFEGSYAGTAYWAFVDANTGEAAQILQVADTQDGELAL